MGCFSGPLTPLPQQRIFPFIHFSDDPADTVHEDYSSVSADLVPVPPARRFASGVQRSLPIRPSCPRSEAPTW